jgi:hypothetical protein
MRKRTRIAFVGAVVVGAFVGLAFLMTTAGPASLRQAHAALQEGQVPEGQSYIGTKKCAACHFNQYMAWRKTEHAKAFDVLPKKYKEDGECLQCHTTGYDEPTGYKETSSPDLVGTSCEACHGPGSKHGELATKFGKKKLTEDEEKTVRGSIHKISPDNACITCHISKAHKKHPDYDKE